MSITKLTPSDFDFRERDTWQKERESLKEAKNKLEQQKELDEVKVKEFTVSVFLLGSFCVRK